MRARRLAMGIGGLALVSSGLTGVAAASPADAEQLSTGCQDIADGGLDGPSNESRVEGHLFEGETVTVTVTDLGDFDDFAFVDAWGVTSSSPVYVARTTVAEGDSWTYTFGTDTADDFDQFFVSVGALDPVTATGTCTGPIGTLNQTIEAADLSHGTEQSLLSRLTVPDTNDSNAASRQTCNKLVSFINHVTAQTGKTIATDLADNLIADAETAQSSLNCDD